MTAGLRQDRNNREPITVDVRTARDGRLRAMCKFGEVGQPGLARDEYGQLTGHVQAVPPLILVNPNEIAAIRGGPACATIAATSELGIHTELIGDLLVMTAPNGSWTWLTYPAVVAGDTGYLLGVWPD